MSDYNWCHGPECHTQQTQSRVRGSGTNKVLRTIKIKLIVIISMVIISLTIFVILDVFMII